MPVSSRYLHCIGIVTPNGAFKAFMTSSSSSGRGRNHWPRGYCVRAPVGAYGGLTEIDPFASNDSNITDVMGANHGFRQVYNGPSFQAWGAQQQQLWYWRPLQPGLQQEFCHWRPSQPGLPPKSADHRNWIRAASQPPQECERFKVLSYNILADYLALDHYPALYFHIPKYLLDWEWRKRRLLVEFGLWSPDIMCLQEVDRFYDLERELAIQGYAGIWKMRTGNAVDGCAIFWRTNRFHLRHEEHIEFNNLGLRDNVAQICVFESIMQNHAKNPAAALHTRYSQSSGANQVVVCNTHVLYNPKRGEIKLGQVRVLLDRAYAVSKDWNNAPVIVCGDFNSTPKSPLYNFISTQKLNLSGLTRDQISGQYSATLHNGPNYGFSSYSRVQSRSPFGTRQDYYKSRPEYQHNVGNPSTFDNSTVVMYPDVQLKADKQMSISATTIKSGEVEIFSHHGGEVSSSYLKHANMPNRTSDISGQQSIVHVNKEADTNGEAVKKGEDAQSLCFDDHPFSSEVMYPDVQLKADEQMSISATTIKSGEAEIFSHHGGEVSSSHLKQANMPNRTSDISNQQSIVHMNKEADKNGEAVKKGEDAQSLCFDDHPFSSEVQKGHRSSKTLVSIADFIPKILDKTCFEDHKVSPGRSYVAGGIALSSISCIDNSIASSLPPNVNFHGFHEDNYISSAPSSHISTDEFSIMSLSSDAFDIGKTLHVDVADDALSKEKSSTSSASLEISMVESAENSSPGSAVAEKAVQLITCLNSGKGDELNLYKFDVSRVSDRMVAVSSIEYKKVMKNMDSDGDIKKVSDDKILQVPTRFRDLSSDTVSAENGASPELSCLENEDHQSHELSCLEENADANFLKELHGMEVENQTLKDFDSAYMELMENSTFPVSSTASNGDRYLYNRYSWSSMEMGIASGKANCTVVEHPLKLRSVYRDVEDCTGTKDSSREPQVTSYNLQFMGTVDYIWCSDDLITATVLDTIPLHILRRTPGFPTEKWGSDHISLVCELAFSRGSQRT